MFRLDLPPDRLHQLVASLERLIAAGLCERTIAAAVATGTDGITSYLAREFVSADSLDIVLRDRGPRSVSESLRVASDLAGALDAAAAAYVHHGALHPRDVLVSDEVTKLTGVGIGQAIEQVGVALPVRRPYTAPERISGLPWDRRADVFSLAAVMHEMLWRTRVTGIGEEAADALTDLPGADLQNLRQVFSRALAGDPKERYETAGEFARALAAAFEDEATTVADEGPVTAGERTESGHSSTRDGRAPARRGLPRISTDNDDVARDLRLPLDELKVWNDLESAPLEAGKPRESLVDLGASPPAVAGPMLAPSPPDVESAPAPVGAAPDGDLELRPGDLDRFADLQSAPVVASDARVNSHPDDVSRAESGPGDLRAMFGAHPANDSGTEAHVPTRHGGPIVAALTVGMAIGVGVGYVLFGSRVKPDVPPPQSQQSQTTASVETASSSAPGERPVQGDGALRSQPVRAQSPQPAPAQSDRPSTTASKPIESSSPLREQPSQRGATAAPAARGRLRVRSTPSGARLFVDGREHGTTPATVRDLAPGRHRVRIVQAGFIAEDRRVVVTVGRPAQTLTVDLLRSRVATKAVPSPTPSLANGYTGKLEVESRPPGARVFIDGKLAGTTPLSIAEMGAGEHTVRLEQEGYRRWSSLIRVVTGERNRLTASLER